MRKKITVSDEIKSSFKEGYLSGQSCVALAHSLQISNWTAFQLKREMSLNLEKWQKLGLPERFSKKTEAIIYGTLLGDSSLFLPGNNVYHSFSCTHSPKQKEYLEFKRELLAELKPYPISGPRDKWGSLQLRTTAHPQLSEMHKIIYPNGIKTITQNIVNSLTEQSLSLWFMDDGSLLSDKSGFSIATCSFSVEENLLLSDFIENQFQIKSIVTNNIYPRIFIYGLNALKFRDLIEKYVPKCMKYKLDLKPGVGTGVSKTRLSLEQINNLKKDFDKMSPTDLAVKYDLTRNYVYRILNGKRRNTNG